MPSGSPTMVEDRHVHSCIPSPSPHLLLHIYQYPIPQVDGSVSSIEMLPSIIEAVQATCTRLKIPPIPVILDSGVRYGQHVVKAMALGAAAVMVGRPPVIGLALGGQQGVEQVMMTLVADMECTALNAGIADLKMIDLSMLVRAAMAQPPPFVGAGYGK